MSNHVLTTPREADSLIARMFSRDRTCLIRVREDRAFKADGWLSFGTITLDSGAETPDQIMGAVRRGAFEWNVPDIQPTREDLAKLLGLKTDDKSALKKLARALDAMSAVSAAPASSTPGSTLTLLKRCPFGAQPQWSQTPRERYRA